MKSVSSFSSMTEIFSFTQQELSGFQQAAAMNNQVRSKRNVVNHDFNFSPIIFIKNTKRIGLKATPVE